MPDRRFPLLAVLLAGALAAGPLAALAARPPAVAYNRDVRPILADACFACHGPDAGKRAANLRLDVRDSAVARGAVVPGKPEQSRLLTRVLAADPARRMPPPSAHKLLTASQKETLRRWIAAAAPYEAHWAYQPPKAPPVPAVRDTRWPLSPVDRFLLARMEAAGVAPSAEADRVTLVRRLSFDLTGLPPAPAEVDAFLQDPSPGAYERVVDRLLASPRFGERMASYWLDLVRYADTVGYHGDQEHAISPYRDWVIQAFNRDLPFDRFTAEQLAGDLLPNPTVNQRIATGYNRLLQTTHEGGAQDREYLAKYAADRVRNLTQVWMGATVGCAECHDHKYDPYTQKDFYSLAAFFADVQERGAYSGPDVTPANRPPEIEVLSPFDQEEVERLEARIGALQAAGGAADEVARLARERDAVRKRTRRTMVTVSRAPRPVRVLARGDWMDETGPEVRPAVPPFLPRLTAAGERPTRLDLARWLTRPEHPQTARVFVNRVWYLLFGAGLCRSLEDFGAQGEVPTHPELLDWLAAVFAAPAPPGGTGPERGSAGSPEGLPGGQGSAPAAASSPAGPPRGTREPGPATASGLGWSVKRLVRLIVTSRAYRQSSLVSAALRERDPENRLFARQGRFRLPAEMIRDQALAASGLLVERLGGPSARPYQPDGYYALLNFPKRTYEAHRDDNQYRRGVYVHWQRQYLHPMLRAFDAPSREECTAQRPVTNTPLAALTLLNDPTFVEAARVLAARILREGGSTEEARLRWAWRVAVSRAPDPRETASLARLYRSNREVYAADPAAAKALLGTGLAPVPADLDPVDLAAWTAVARALLNLSETITRN